MTLSEFLLARIAEDEMWAREASRHGDEPLAGAGAHWRWECDEHDEPVTPDPSREFMTCTQDGWSVGLRSVETYPYRSIPGAGPTLALSGCEEVATVVAGHIARHDPARVLAECEAKRRIVEIHWEDDPDKHWRFCIQCSDDEHLEPYPCPTVRLLAMPYADHPDYRDEWKP